MRDINRIDSFCAQLAEKWKKLPDWRFAQLLSNFSSEEPIFFYDEDEQFFKKLFDYIDRTAPDT